MYSSTCFWLCIMGPGSYFRCLCVDKASLWNIPQELSLDGVSTLQYVSFVSPFVRLKWSSVLFVDLLLFSTHEWVSTCVRLPVFEAAFYGCVCSCFFFNRNEWFFACEKLPLCEHAARTCVYVHVRSKLWGSQGGRPVVSSRMYLHLKLQGQD